MAIKHHLGHYFVWVYDTCEHSQDRMITNFLSQIQCLWLTFSFPSNFGIDVLFTGICELISLKQQYLKRKDHIQVTPLP